MEVHETPEYGGIAVCLEIFFPNTKQNSESRVCVVPQKP